MGEALSGSSARRYAEALLQIATTEKAEEEFAASFERLRQALGGEILRALRNPGVPLRARQAAIEAATAAEPKAIRSLLGLLLERERVALFPQIALAYADLVERRAGIVKGRITTATELSTRERDLREQHDALALEQETEQRADRLRLAGGRGLDRRLPRS